MGGDKVDAAHRVPVELREDLKATADRIAQVADRACVPLDEAAHGVAVAPVPDCPAIADEGADLVEAGGVPGFNG